MEWTAAVLPAFVALIHTNIDGDVSLQGDDTNLGAPAIDVPFAKPTISNQRWYSQPFVNLTGMAAKKKWRIRVVNNSVPVIVGEIWMGSTYRQLTTGMMLLTDTISSRAPRTLVHETNYGVKMTYAQAPPRRMMQGSCIVAGADLTALKDWHESARGATRPFMIVPDALVNDAQLVRFAADGLSLKPLGNGYHQATVGFEELSRGLQWVVPA
jgi:hypothetical protein